MRACEECRCEREEAKSGTRKSAAGVTLGQEPAWQCHTFIRRKNNWIRTCTTGTKNFTSRGLASQIWGVKIVEEFMKPRAGGLSEPKRYRWEYNVPL